MLGIGRSPRAGKIESINTRLSGSARVDSTLVLPSGKLGTKLIKITEDVRKYAAEQRSPMRKRCKREWNKREASSQNLAPRFIPRPDAFNMQDPQPAH